nr:MAG TPA: hypothetical protein [Bacteriophage sp.]
MISKKERDFLPLLFLFFFNYHLCKSHNQP